MREILRPKLLLFFAISIMSFYITSEKSYATDQVTSASSYSYLQSFDQACAAIRLYSQYAYHQVKDFICSFSLKSHSVKIQIMGNKNRIPVDDEYIRGCRPEDDNEANSKCPEGDMECENNKDYFNNAFYDGMLVSDNHGSEKIDEYDTKYCGYNDLEHEIRHQDTAETNSFAVDLGVSNDDGQSFDKIKDYYDERRYGL